MPKRSNAWVAIAADDWLWMPAKTPASLACQRRYEPHPVRAHPDAVEIQ